MLSGIIYGYSLEELGRGTAHEESGVRVSGGR